MSALQLGNVVVSLPHGDIDGGRRGVVISANGRGEVPRLMETLPDTAYVVERSPGCHVVTYDPGHWVEVPEEEWTREESVLSGHLRWQADDWRAEDEQRATDSWEWALVRSLLTPVERERVFPEDGDWPIDWLELMTAVARVLDDRIEQARTLGTALGRLR